MDLLERVVLAADLALSFLARFALAAIVCAACCSGGACNVGEASAPARAPAPALGRSTRALAAPGHPRLRLMPLGDHLVRGQAEGQFQRASWREGLWFRAAGAIDYVGANRWAPPWLPDAQWEGREDFATHNFTEYVDGWLAEDNPDVVLLEAGAVDIARDYDRPVAPDNLRRLVDRILAHDPDTRVLVATLPHMAGDMGMWAWAFDVQVDASVAERHDARVTLCDLRPAISDGDLLADGIHPTPEGDDKIAAVWWSCLLSL